jgi:thermitase
MNTHMRRCVVVLAVCLFAPPGAIAAIQPEAASYVPGELIVKFREGVSTHAASAAAAAKGHSVVASLRLGGLSHVKLAPSQSVAFAMAAYRSDPDVEYVQPNYIYRAAAVPNDPHYAQLWGFRNTGQTISPSSYPTNNPGVAASDARIERAWNVLTDCSAVIVAVIDSGVNHAHQDLAQNMWNGGAAYPNHGYDFVDGDDDPMDLNGHGTHVAGTIGAAGNNGLGVAGVCWNAEIMAVRVLGHTGSGSTAGIIQGINFAVDHGAKVINMSLGGGGTFDPAFSAAIAAAQTADVAVIVAAGNEATNVDGGEPSYPCAFTHPNLLCVAALDQAYQLAEFSNYGTTSVDVGAPGTNIRSAWHAAETIVADPLNAGWSGSSSTGGGWFYTTLETVNVVANPGNFPAGVYNHDTDDRVFKTFDLSGVDVASLGVAVLASVASGDYLSARCSNAVADPFSGAGVTLFETNGATADGERVSLDLTPCAGAPASLGFRLTSNSSVTDQGVAFGLFTITTQRLNTVSYKTIDGTSMATPLVAGIATMLRAHNPLYTAVDVVTAIKAAGVSVGALVGKTTTGKAADAASTLSHIHRPAGLTATIE